MTIIRSAREADLPAILEIYNHVILNTTAVYAYEPHTLEMRQAWYDGKIKDGYPLFVAEDAGRIAGLSTYGPFRAWPAYKYTVENSVYVAADQRGKGIARLLMQPLIEAARDQITMQSLPVSMRIMKPACACIVPSDSKRSLTFARSATSSGAGWI
jgi:L-amino acid N-acyltransferase YncA